MGEPQVPVEVDSDAQLRPWQWKVQAFVNRHQWVRVVMHSETGEWVKQLNPDELDALEISGEEWRERERFRSYRAVHYPEFDVCAGILDEQFDLILAEQIWEHLPWPYRAARNVHSMLRPGGHFLLTTPFMIKIHGGRYGDYSRWTEVGMRHFLAECGFDFDLIQTGSWGNRACVKANLNTWALKWPWRSLRNQPDFPVSVWALARKAL